MRLIQFIDHNLGPCVGVVLEDSVLNVTELSPSLSSVVIAFREARRTGVRLVQSLECLIAQQPRSTLGDIHVHFFGTSKLSFPGRTWKYATDDVVEIAVEGLGRPLRNPIRRLDPSEAPVAVSVG